MLGLWETVYLVTRQTDDKFEKKINAAFIAAYPNDNPANKPPPKDMRASRLRKLAFRIAFCTDMYFRMEDEEREAIGEAANNSDELPELLEALGNVEGAYLLNKKRLS